MLRHFKSMLEGNRKVYAQFWEKFGATMKEGIASDYVNKDALIDLTLFHSSLGEEPVTLKEYVAKMATDQTVIYYMTGESLVQLRESPYLEKLKKKNFPVLYLIDPVDEWVMNSVREYEGRKVVSITSESLDLGADEAKAQEELKSKEEQFRSLSDNMKKVLAAHIKDVKVSNRLVDSPVCLVSASNDPSAHMERIMEKFGQKAPKAKRILEINPDHPVFAKMQGFPEKTQEIWAQILYHQALLNEGSPIDNPAQFSKLLSDLMVGSSQ